MARRVFFSFHYERDIWRVNQVRNSWVTRGVEAAGFLDAASWEAVKRRGDTAVKQWIDRQMDGTSVTVVLIGNETASRKYVNYEIKRSHDLGKGLIGIHIHNLKNREGQTDWQGSHPFDNHVIPNSGWGFFQNTFSSHYPSYNWLHDDGYNNFGSWVDDAAGKALLKRLQR